MLSEIPLPVNQGHSYHGKPKICRGAQRITGKHPQTAAIGRDFKGQADFHGKIGDSGKLSIYSLLLKTSRRVQDPA
jgi:hypothetical protein